MLNDIMDTAIIIIIDTLLESVRKCFNASEEQMNVLIITFINDLPSAWRERFTLPEVA